MSETRGSYHDTYVESVEWQRDKAYARAYAAEARAEKAEAEVERLREQIEGMAREASSAELMVQRQRNVLEKEVERLRATLEHRGSLYVRAYTAEAEVERIKGHAMDWKKRFDDAMARAEKLAAALREIKDGTWNNGRGTDLHVRKFAARALAEIENNEGGKK